MLSDENNYIIYKPEPHVKGMVVKISNLGQFCLFKDKQENFLCPESC